MSRNRMTWNTHKQATPPPQIPSVDRTEKGDHPAYYPDPAIDDFAKGDPDAWAETPKPPPYLETAPPNMPGNLTTEQPDHPAYPDLDVMPPSTPVTAKEARLYRQAALCQYIATKLLEQGGQRVPMAQLQSIERKASQRLALTSEEKVTAGLMRAIEHKAAQLMDLSHSDLLKTAKTLNLASPKDSALATSAKQDWASFNRMAAEMEEKEKEEEDDSEGKQAFFDEILAESDEDEDEDETASKKSAARKSKKSEDDEDDEKKDKKEEKKNPFASKKPKKKASTLQQIKAALALIGEDDEDEDEDEDDGETASRRAEEDDEDEDDDDTASKKASQLLAQYIKAAKKGEDDDEEDEEDEEDENPFASKKKASAKVQRLKRLLKAAEEEEKKEEKENPFKDGKNPFEKKEAAQNTAILNTMERKIAKLEKLLGKRADALEVAQSPFAGLVDDVIAADGVDQNDPEYGYSTAEDRMLLAALEKLERKDQKRKAQKSKTAVEVELHALLNELDRMAEGEDDEADDDDDGGKKATPEAQISVAPRNPNADSGAGGNIDPDQAPVTPQVEGPMHTACPEDMDGMGEYDDPMAIMDLGLEEGTALDSAMMPDVDPQELLDFEMMAEAEAQPRQAKQASTKLPLKPQPKKASAGAQRLGQVAAPQSSEVDDLSQLWGSVPDVRAHFGIPKTY